MMQPITGRARRELRLFKAKYSKRTGTSGNYEYEYDPPRSDAKFKQSLSSSVSSSLINSPPEKDYADQNKMINWLSKDLGGGRTSNTIKNFFKEEYEKPFEGTINFRGKKVNRIFEAAESGLMLAEIRGNLEDVYLKGKKKIKSKKTLKMINDKKLAPIAALKGGKSLLASLNIGKDGTIFMYDKDKGEVIPLAGSVGELMTLLKRRKNRKKGLFSFGKKK